MATSESDDFESADEEMNHEMSTRRNYQTQQWKSPTTIDSESDDDMEYVPRQPHANVIFSRRPEKYRPLTNIAVDESKPDNDISVKDTNNCEKNEQPIINVDRTCEKVHEDVTARSLEKAKCTQINTDTMNFDLKDNSKETRLDNSEIKEDDSTELQSETVVNPNEKGRACRRQNLGAKKLGTKITSSSNSMVDTDDATKRITETDILTRSIEDDILFNELSIKDEITESEMPEEMKSDKTFKEVFGEVFEEGFGDDIKLEELIQSPSEELSEDRLQPMLEKSLVSEEAENPLMGWGWANWGVTSLINTASVGVSTLTSHVSHGLTLLEESIVASDEPKSITNEEEKEDRTVDDYKAEQPKEQSSFGFGNLISGVSSITKLVESTSSKVMSGGLDTLEAIGKKTMEVLQEGDPGLKKKRAFFINETDKPNLSQILREAKEKAESNEKTIEARQKMRKVHFESLFDDYQGLVHLEALEMLSKQSDIKIQQHLSSLDANELYCVQKMLEEVKELCELNEEDESEDESEEKDLKFKLQEACSDLGINITYEKLYDICENSKTYTTPPVTQTDEEIFEHVISLLAQFTAFSVERFHKTAELLLIKEHRSTVNETDSLVQLTNILSKEIGTLANTYCSILNKFVETSEKPDNIKANITTVFLEASNASSYIQDAFKLLIPIIQVGAI
ncbi:protein FAM114A2 [Xylocopa sonorina]|uniref:protein FAM114A2 n=1 Tax=Xylocopa sonorina TaxID=1818115 RepID=UPI00403AD658